MRIVNLRDQEEQTAFAKEAVAFFAKDPDLRFRTWTRGEIVPGCLLAIRWGAGEDCVAVLKLDDFHQPVIYEQIIKEAP